MSLHRTVRRTSGFTLIEVLVSLALFTIIGLSTVKYITQISNTKRSAFQDLDLYNSLRATLSMLRFDLSESFHVLYDDLGADNKQAVLANIPAPHTLFDGRKNEMVFTALSHRVYYANRRECEQTALSYFLQKREGHKFPSLMKRESGMIGADLYQGGPIYTLLDDVSLLELKYWDDKQSKWIDDWNSDGEANRDRFPFAVKLKIEVADSTGKKLGVQTEFKVAFPNDDAVLVQF